MISSSREFKFKFLFFSLVICDPGSESRQRSRRSTIWSWNTWATRFRRAVDDTPFLRRSLTEAKTGPSKKCGHRPKWNPGLAEFVTRVLRWRTDRIRMVIGRGRSADRGTAEKSLFVCECQMKEKRKTVQQLSRKTIRLSYEVVGGTLKIMSFFCSGDKMKVRTAESDALTKMHSRL